MDPGVSGTAHFSVPFRGDPFTTLTFFGCDLLGINFLCKLMHMGAHDHLCLRE